MLHRSNICAAIRLHIPTAVQPNTCLCMCDSFAAALQLIHSNHIVCFGSCLFWVAVGYMYYFHSIFHIHTVVGTRTESRSCSVHTEILSLCYTIATKDKVTPVCQLYRTNQIYASLRMYEKWIGGADLPHNLHGCHIERCALLLEMFGKFERYTLNSEHEFKRHRIRTAFVFCRINMYFCLAQTNHIIFILRNEHLFSVRVFFYFKHVEFYSRVMCVLNTFSFKI